jgi:hypothetical protein
MNTSDHSINAEVHTAREAILNACGDTFEALTLHANKIGEDMMKEGWRFSQRPMMRRKETSAYEVLDFESSIVREEPTNNN